VLEPADKRTGDQHRDDRAAGIRDQVEQVGCEDHGKRSGSRRDLDPARSGGQKDQRKGEQAEIGEKAHRAPLAEGDEPQPIPN
jgi:hypothetical protein